MSNYENSIVENIRNQYVERELTGVDKLTALDRRVKKPARIFAYIFGTVGSLVLGTGMCFAMKVIGDMMPLGILVGIVGIAMVSANYFIYDKMLSGRKRKYSAEILELSSGLLNDGDV